MVEPSAALNAHGRVVPSSMHQRRSSCVQREFSGLLEEGREVFPQETKPF